MWKSTYVAGQYDREMFLGTFILFTIFTGFPTAHFLHPLPRNKYFRFSSGWLMCSSTVELDA